MKKKLAVIMCALIAGSSLMSFSGCQIPTAQVQEEPYEICGTVPPEEKFPNSSKNSETADSPTSTASTAEDTPVGNSPPFVRADSADLTITKEEQKSVQQAINTFSAMLFRREFKRNTNGENTLISPLSVYTVLSLFNNGTNSDTQTQITDVLSGYFNQYIDGGVMCYVDYNPIEQNALNGYFDQFMFGLYSGDEINTKLSMANSVWTLQKDGLIFNEDFKTSASDYYNAEIFNEPINNATIDKINSWVTDNTDGMINQILDEDSLSKESVAVLLNAIAFDGKWKEEYTENNVSERDFHNYDGTISKKNFMYSEETLYLDDGKATGFIKDYRGNGYIKYPSSVSADGAIGAGGSVELYSPRYCFVALMPNEDIGIDEYVQNYFSDSTIRPCLKNRINCSK